MDEKTNEKTRTAHKLTHDGYFKTGRGERRTGYQSGSYLRFWRWKGSQPDPFRRVGVIITGVGGMIL